MVTVANVLHCSKLLPGCIVYSGLNMNLPPCAEQQLFARLSFTRKPHFSFLQPEGVVYSHINPEYIKIAIIFWNPVKFTCTIITIETEEAR